MDPTLLLKGNCSFEYLDDVCLRELILPEGDVLDEFLYYIETRVDLLLQVDHCVEHKDEVFEVFFLPVVVV